jgi:hypothetical protein
MKSAHMTDYGARFLVEYIFDFIHGNSISFKGCYSFAFIFIESLISLTNLNSNGLFQYVVVHISQGNTQTFTA